MELSSSIFIVDQGTARDHRARGHRARGNRGRGNRGRGRAGGGRAGRGGAARGRAARGRAAGGGRPRDPELEWSATYNPPADRPFAEPAPGPTQRYPNGPEIREGAVFDQMFPDEIWDLIVAETNRYHDQQVTAEPNKHKRKWTPITKGEVQAFIGIMIYMGIVKLPRLTMYWSVDNLLHQASVSSVMTVTRFFQIWRYFHLADNSKALPREDPRFDKIYRVRQFLDLVMANAQHLYRLDRDVSIDETMVPHKGRLSFKQYIKNKPVRWGIKLWVLCEAKTGYVFKFQVYLGKEDGNVEYNLARRVVKHLIAPIEDKFHNLYMDNFYCDPHLFLELETKKVLACGTIRANRKGFPKDLVITSAMEKRLNRGDCSWRSHGNLVAMAWYDKRPVYLISTIHPPESVGAQTTVQRRSQAGPRKEIPCPPAQCAYQEYMGGVDLADQILQSFSVIRKSRKAWKKLFYYGLEVCLLNSFTIFKKVKQTRQDFLSYRISIVRHLLEGKCFRGRPGRLPSRPLADLDATRLNKQYHSVAVEEKRRDCVVCAKIVSVQNLSRSAKSRTNTVCVTCDRKPLCILSHRNCWEKWHNLVEYWR